MGRFSSTVHIKNNTDRTRFEDSFCDVMKKRGFEPCSEDEAALSYLLAFGEGGWVTLSSGGYADNPYRAYDDMRQTAEKMKTSGFSVEVVDSDFAILKLFGENTEEVIVGDGSGYGIENGSKGSKKCWEPLLSESNTWEKLSEIWGNDEIFVEDALWKSAPIFGIAPEYMTADYEELLDKADGSKNITAFYFTKAAAKNKSMSLNAAFVKVFGEALEPLGFKKTKCSHPYFLRIVGGEVIHIITYRKMSGHPIVDGWERQDYGQYDIVGKVKTIYSPKIDFAASHLERNSSLFSNSDIYRKEHALDFDYNYWHSIFYYFPFKPGDEKQMLSSFEHAFAVTQQNLLPALDSAFDISSYLEFHYKFSNSSLYLGYEHGNYEHFNEYCGLVHIKADTCGSYVERNEKYAMREFDIYEERYKKSYANDPEKLSHYLKIVDEDRKKFVSGSCDRQYIAAKMFNDKEWCEKALEELERRRLANTETLKSYGLVL